MTSRNLMFAVMAAMWPKPSEPSSSTCTRRFCLMRKRPISSLTAFTPKAVPSAQRIIAEITAKCIPGLVVFVK